MNNFITHNDSNNILVGGTSLQGYVTVNYKTLVSVFGEPFDGDGYKTDAEWWVQFDDGQVATIYDYKVGKNYNGPRGMNKEDINEWNIGGKSKEMVHRISEIIHLKTLGF